MIFSIAGPFSPKTRFPSLRRKHCEKSTMLRSIPTQKSTLHFLRMKALTNENIALSQFEKIYFQPDIATAWNNQRSKLIFEDLRKHVNAFSQVIEHALQRRTIIEFRNFIFARIKILFGKNCYIVTLENLYARQVVEPH